MRPFFFYSRSTIDVGGDELPVLREIFGEDGLGDLIGEIPTGSLVIPRFRAIPFGRELEREMELRGSRLINSFEQHRTIADIFEWVGILGELTAPAHGIDALPYLPEGRYFAKGQTNSKKNDWFRSAYAESKAQLISTVGNLQSDGYLQGQAIAIRPFQDFRELGRQVDGRPYFNERRAFVLDGKLLSEAFYWSSFLADGGVAPEPDASYWETLEEAIRRTDDLSRFYVIDLAEMSSGGWQVVELNDGPMAGLSENSTESVFGELYRRLSGSGE